ncbi:hypothetical protein Dda_4474 [Drechslerella dactyloides]|uniref:Uncharacterized protein n=1 Tax=Drechslerella dactyloides TaxID=74499 RepID=A0AAD6IZ71_DREDA|nr:hypothetical protein Dda_4474 [Drechslerella dactyloides]
MVHATPTFLATVILVTILLIAPPCLSSPDGAQTIDVLTAYTGLRGCAQLCFWQPSPGGFRTDVIASYLSCSQVYIYSGALESCWCRADYRADVLSHLASCVRESCAAEPGTYTVDVERATSLYAGYCASAESVAQADVGAGITSAGGGVAEETGGSAMSALERTVTVTATATAIITAVADASSAERLDYKAASWALLVAINISGHPDGSIDVRHHDDTYLCDAYVDDSRHIDDSAVIEFFHRRILFNNESENDFSPCRFEEWIVRRGDFRDSARGAHVVCDGGRHLADERRRRERPGGEEKRGRGEGGDLERGTLRAPRTTGLAIGKINIPVGTGRGIDILQTGSGHGHLAFKLTAQQQDQQQQHSRSQSSPAVVAAAAAASSSSSGLGRYREHEHEPPTTSPLDSTDLLPAEFAASSSAQSLVLLHHPSHPISVSRRPQTAPQLQLATNTLLFAAAASNTSPTATSTAPANPSSATASTSYGTLSLLDVVGTGSGRRKLKEFPGYIPLSRYFIPPSAAATPVAGNTPTTPTRPSFGRGTPDVEGAATPKFAAAAAGAGGSIGGRGIFPNEGSVAQSLSQINGTTKMEQQRPVVIVGDPEPLMTQDLLNFYKNRLHELEQSTQQELLERISVLRGFLLEHHDATNRLERQLHELQDENTSLSKELEDSIKHRVEMMALVKENEILKERIDQLSKNASEQIYDPTPIPSPDPSVTGSSREPDQYDKIQTHYEDLIQQLLQKLNELTAARESERALSNQNIDQLNDRCKRLETVVSDSLEDISRERSRRVGLEEKLKETEEELNVSVFEMQSQIEIFERHINESRMSPVDLQTVQEEEQQADTDQVLPPEMFDDIPDVAADDPNAERKSLPSPTHRKTPSPTKQRTPSPTLLGARDQGAQTEQDDDSRDIQELRQELQTMIAERAAEEALIKSKKAEFEAAYDKFAGIVEQARARDEEYNLLKTECEELRIHIEELIEQHDFDQEELLARQSDLDAMFRQLEDSLKQQVVDKQELTKANAQIEDLKKQLEETDTVSIVKDDTELKNLRLRLDEAKREKGVDEEAIAKANREIEMLRGQLEDLDQQRSAQVEAIEKGKGELLDLQAQIETLNKQRSTDVETISSANTEIESLRKQLEEATLASTQSTNEELNTLRAKLSDTEAAKTALEKERSRKDGDVKLLREQMQGLLRGQSTKESELTRTREDLDSLRKRYDELVSDRKKDEEWRHENFMELEAVRQRLSDVMRIKDQEHSLHQRDVDAWERKDEENQQKLMEVSGRLAEMVLQVNGRNDIMKELNETVTSLKLADEASSRAIEEANKKIAELEKEVQEEKRKVAVEVTRANDRVAEAREKQRVAEAETERLNQMIQDLEERISGYEMAVEATEDSTLRVQELERQVTEMTAQMQKLVLEADMEVEAMDREIEDAKAHAVEVAQEANVKIDALERDISVLKEAVVLSKGEADGKMADLQTKLVDAKSDAARQLAAADNELKKLEMQIRVEEAKASATLAAANERLAVLEKQIRTYETLKRHKAQDETDLHTLKSHVVKIERIALQFLPLEDSGMLNAIDELKRSHLETQQKHKKRRKKELMMAEKCGIQL